MAVFRPIAAVLFIIALPIALVTTNIRIVLNEPRVYSYATDHFDTPATTGIARSELLRASAELRAYFNNGDDKIFIRVHQGGQPVSLFNDRETTHLHDVKTLFRAMSRVQEAAVIFVLAYVVTVFIWAREGNLRSLAKQTAISGAVGIAFIAAVGIAALVGFNATFDRFHRLLFTNDFWQLDPARDHLIQMFPDGFWQDVSIWIGVGSIVEFVVLATAAGAYLWTTRERPVPPPEVIFEGAQA